MGRSARLSLSIPADEALLPRVARTGVGFVELASVPPLGGRIKSLSNALKSAGLKAATLHGPHGPAYDIGNSDPKGRKEALRLHREHLQFCASLGAVYYVIHPGFENHLNSIGGTWDDMRKVIVFQREESAMARLWETNAGSITELADFSASLSVKIALETGPTNLITTTERLRIVKAAERNNVGVCLDTGHVNVGGVVKPQDAIKEVGRLLWALHLNDNKEDGDFHLPPGKGTIDWHAVVHALAGACYQGTFNIELSPPDWKSEDAWNGAKEAVTFLNTVLD